MTEKELNQLYWLKKEIEQQQKRLSKLRLMSKIRHPVLTDIPKSTEQKNIIEYYVINVVDLENIIQSNIERCIEETKKIESFIATINDSEMRQIVTLRSIQGLTWEQIGQKLNSDRTTVSKKFRKFLKFSHKSH